MNSSAQLATELECTVAAALPDLRAFGDGPETARPNRPSGTGWSRREELGHLIDSAVNNHVRIVRAALDGRYEGPGYDQDAWIAVHRYREARWSDLVDAWQAHHRVLVPLIRSIPDKRLSAPCTIGAEAPVALGFVIDDYVLHMRHHLDQILRRSPVTRYPRA